MHELSKSIHRRLHTPGFVKYFAGHGIDIGAGSDGLHQWRSLFPLMKTCRVWDKDDGDAQAMGSVADGTYDFVHSSHCLEHMVDPAAALASWWRILKPGGHLIVMVPDEDLYEQNVWPSAFNSDHKHTFTIWKAPETSWSPVSRNVLGLIGALAAGGDVEVLRVELLEDTYRRERPPEDQTLNAVTESAIEFVLRKRRVQTSAAGAATPTGSPGRSPGG